MKQLPKPSDYLFDWLDYLLVLILIVALCCSCTCQQRMAYIQKHCPECFEPDTLHLIDTVEIAPLYISEAFLIPDTDTIQTLDTPDYTITLQWVADSLIVEVETPPDTVFQYIDAPVLIPQPPCPKPRPHGWIPWALIGSLAVGYYVGRRVRTKLQ